MKYRALLLILSLGCIPGIDLQAEEPVVIEDSATKEKALLTPAQIDELLAPIALYPDPLVAIMLPAATFPADIVMAARYLKAGGASEAIDEQPWDDSVKALARYPDVLKWMDENLAWTQQVGAAFLLQPDALLAGTQRLRASALAAGNLKDSPEQTVVTESEVIRIVPAQREVIYVPVYDPFWAYRPRPIDVYFPGPVVTFSTGYRTGFWLSYYCNWGYSTVVVINRPYRSVVWQKYPTWNCPPDNVVYRHHVWRPAPVRVQNVRRDFERRPDFPVARPSPNSYVRRGPDRDNRPDRDDPTRGSPRPTSDDRRPNRPASLSPDGNASTTGITPAAPQTGRQNNQVGNERGDSPERPRRNRPATPGTSSDQTGQPGDRNNSPSPVIANPGDTTVPSPAPTRPRPSGSGAGETVRPSRPATVPTGTTNPEPSAPRQPGRRLPQVENPATPGTTSAPSRLEQPLVNRRPQPGLQSPAPSVSGGISAPNAVIPSQTRQVPVYPAPRRVNVAPAQSPLTVPSPEITPRGTSALPSQNRRALPTPSPAAEIRSQRVSPPQSAQPSQPNGQILQNPSPSASLPVEVGETSGQRSRHSR